ncbi:glutathione S-transferase theta-3 [Hydra vulgaris]|uniref:Glutathione S-transferase theta-3 n=1 Tax=Hydra vulgaris TaxID=6087 RepID=A0ABM4CR36_HYDVU
MSLKIFYDAMSQPSRSVLLFLKCTKIPYVPVLVDIAKGGTRTAEYKLISPSQKVPAMQDGDFLLMESSAILKYLCETRNVDSHWYPKNQMERSKVDEYLAWHHLNLRSGASGIVFKSIFKPMLTGQPPSDVTSELKLFQKCLEMFDSYFLKNTLYISGNEVSIADLLALTEFSQLELLGEKSPALTDKVKDWMNRCIKTTEPHYSDVHKIHLKLKNKLISQL